MDEMKTAAFEHSAFHLRSGILLTYIPIWTGPEEKGKLILPVVRSNAPRKEVTFPIPGNRFFACIFQSIKIGNAKQKIYVVVGHVRIMYITTYVLRRGRMQV